MSRQAGDRYQCEKCNAELVYEKSCPCPNDKQVHSEICCEKQMKKIEK